jgi:hypothetical protein
MQLFRRVITVGGIHLERRNETVTATMQRAIRFNETPEEKAARLLELSKELREAAARIISEQERAKREADTTREPELETHERR